jgi:hypothetical protein
MLLTPNREILKPRPFVPNVVHVEICDRYGNLKQRFKTKNLRTNAGTDWQKQQMSGTVSGSATFIGVTANATTPVVGDTTLAAEETTNGLIRATGTVVMGAAGSTSYTVQKLMTYTGGAPITLAKTGLFSAVTGGTMVFVALYGTTASLVNGDQITTTWTISI